MVLEPLVFMGGTFDPIHVGHLRMAIELAEALEVSGLTLLPAADPPLRETPRVPAEQRAHMVELAIEAIPLLRCDRRELGRSGPSYSIDTVIQWREQLGLQRPLVMAIGADAFARFDQWHRWREFIDYCHIVVMARGGFAMPTSEPLHSWWCQHQGTLSGMWNAPAGSIAVHEGRLLEISATDIRARIRAKQSIHALVPSKVENYIGQHALYKETGETNLRQHN